MVRHSSTFQLEKCSTLHYAERVHRAVGHTAKLPPTILVVKIGEKGPIGTITFRAHRHYGAFFSCNPFAKLKQENINWKCWQYGFTLWHISDTCLRWGFFLCCCSNCVVGFPLLFVLFEVFDVLTDGWGMFAYWTMFCYIYLIKVISFLRLIYAKSSLEIYDKLTFLFQVTHIQERKRFWL